MIREATLVIREATLEDIPGVLQMCEKFFKASEYADVTSYDSDTMQAFLGEIIEGDSTVLLVSDRGMVAGIVYPFYFSKDICCQELFWWSEDGNGRELLSRFEQWGKDKGASCISMVCLDALGRERVEKIYRRADYRPSEHSWIKRI